MNWAQIETRYIAAVRAAAGLPELDVRWDGQATANGWRSDVFVRLRLRAVRGDAHERRAELVSGGAGDPHAQYIRPRQYGPRVVVVEHVVESRRQSLAMTSVALGETIRMGLRGIESADLFALAHMGLARVLPSREVSYPDDGNTGRMRSALVYEVEHNAASVAVGAIIDYVESLEMSGTVTHPGSPDIELEYLVEAPGAPTPSPP